MYSRWLWLFILLACGCASNPSEGVLKDFPALRPAGGGKSTIQWTKFDGEDFLVFYGEFPSEPTTGVGIYQGGDPKFRIPRNVSPIPGKLGVFEVAWYPLQDKGAKFYRTCLVDYQKAQVQRGQKTETYATKRHVWIYADTQESLERINSELDKLTMFSARPADIVQSPQN